LLNGAPRLAIELVPRPLWGRNLHNASWWPAESRRQRAQHPLCEICGASSQEVHEVWEYDDQQHVQRLARLIALCRACHEVKHFGLARIKGCGAQAQAHLMRVNAWGVAQAEAHIAEVRALWRERNCHAWTQDLSLFEGGAQSRAEVVPSSE
jgi:hypothetical protein